MHIQEVNEVSGFFRLIWLQIWDISRELFCGKHFGKLCWVLFIKNSFWVNNSVMEMEITDSYWALKNLFSAIFIEVAWWQGRLQLKCIWHFLLLTSAWGFISLGLSLLVVPYPFMIRALNCSYWSEPRI